MQYYFQNFKGFDEAALDISHPLTILIGPNGSGKSNAIEGMELLGYLAQGKPLHGITDINRGGNLEIRGGLAGCPSDGGTFTLGCSAIYTKWNPQQLFDYRLTVSVKEPGVLHESLISSSENLMIFEDAMEDPNILSGSIRIRYNNFARGGRKPIEAASAGRSVLSQYSQFAHDHAKIKECNSLINAFSQRLKALFVFDPQPSRMRTYERIGHSVLLKDGSNLSSVLYALKDYDNARSSLERLLAWIKQIPEEPFEEIDFVTTNLNDVIFVLKTNHGQIIDARLLSDGTLRSLAVLTALETAKQGSNIVIEEFDNGLHPSRVNVVIEAMLDCCRRNRIRAIVTTHNPATLNALDNEQLDGVHICTRDLETGNNRIFKLLDLPRHEELLESGRLGDLVTRRIVDKYLAPGFEERRKENTIKWIESLP